MKKSTLFSGLILAATVGGFYVFIQQSLNVSNSTTGTAPTINETTYIESTQAANVSEAPHDVENQEDNFEEELIGQLQKSYLKTIHQLHIQASLIRVKEFVMRRYPADGWERFVSIINRAFPDYAQSIISILERLAVYNDWLVDNQSVIASLAPMPQKGMLWEKRIELFGDEAELIWLEEQNELAQQKNTMQALMHELDQDHTMSLDEKLYQLTTAVSDHYAGTVQDITVSPSVMVQAFLNFGSVQQALESMPAEERQNTINQIRRQAGYSEEQIEHQSTRDAERNKRWENGLAYMQEREALVASLSDEELPEALNNLRTQYFEHEAITIQREEESEFWRYKRPRLYGVN